MAKTFGTNFLAGLVSGGLGTYLKMKDVERADAREKRDQEAADFLKEQRGRESTRQRNIDAAMDEYAAMEGSGQVLDKNTSGFSPSQVTNLMQQGGQTAVDAQATQIADAEMAAGGPPSKVSSMIPNFADPGGAPMQGAPTVAMRDATNVDRIGGLQRIAMASRDAGAIERLGQAKMDAKYGQEDMAAAAAVMKDPMGPQAQELLGMVKQSVPGASLDFDKETGNFVGSIGSKAVSLSPVQFGQLAVAKNQAARGDPNALKTIAGIDKDLAGIGAGVWKSQLEMAKFAQSAKLQGAQITHMQNQNVNQTATTQANVAHTQEQTAGLQRKAATEEETRGVIGRLYKAKNPNASDDEVKAAGLRVMDGQVDQHAPAEVKLAAAWVKNGNFPDMKSALAFAMHGKGKSPETMRAEIYKSALSANMGNAEQAEKQASRYMKDMAAAGMPGYERWGAVPSRDSLVKGKTYPSPVGPVEWTGSGFKRVADTAQTPKAAPPAPSAATAKAAPPAAAAPTATSNAIAAATAAPTAQSNSVAEAPQGQALDAARSELSAANAEVRKFGLKQRRDNPKAYDEAVARVQRAQQAKEQAEAAWQQWVKKSGMAAAFTGPK